MNDTIGVDISKATLEVWRLSDRRHMRFSNDTDGLKALCKWLGADPVRVIYEATGRFHRDLEAALSKAGHGPVKVNPSRARRYAQATGNIAKTDRVDAKMLAHMGSTLALEPTPVRSKSMHEIKELHVARVALIKDRTACRNRLDTARNKMVVSQLKARERQIDRQIAQIDAELVRLIKVDPELARRYEILMSIRGIGPVAATAMIVDMPKLGTMTLKEAASLAGLAPVTRQSGSWKGKARIFGGRSGLRTLLFMPAVIATRYNAPLRKISLTLYEGGKPWKVAVTAVMRKLGVVMALMVVVFLLGWPLEWAPIVFIFLPIFLPIVQQAELDLLWISALVAVNLQTAFLSPPVAMAAYYLKAVAPQWHLKQIYSGMFQFVGLQVVALILVLAFPAIALWLPSVMFD